MVNLISKIKKIGFVPALYKIKRLICINDSQVISLIAGNGAYDYVQRYRYALDFPLRTNDCETADYENKIWTMWLQGVESAPKIIQKCIATVQSRYESDLIVLTNENISRFVDVPDFVTEKYRKGIISNTHYSDIIRFLAIEKYGGLWLDGTTFLLDEIPDYIRFSDFFLHKSEQKNIKFSIGIIASKPYNPIISKALNLMLEYWKCESRLVSYSVSMFFLAMVIDSNPEYQSLYRKMPHIDTINNRMLLQVLFEQYDAESFEIIKQTSAIQRLSWKCSEEDYDKKGTFYDVLIN